MLLEVRARSDAFIVDVSVRQTVDDALAQVLRLLSRRADLAAALSRAPRHSAHADDARRDLSPTAVQRKSVLSLAQLDAHIAALADDAATARSPDAPLEQGADGASLVFAGRELARGEVLSSYFGRHEKTKAKVQLRIEGDAAAEEVQHGAASSDEARGALESDVTAPSPVGLNGAAGQAAASEVSLSAYFGGGAAAVSEASLEVPSDGTKCALEAEEEGLQLAPEQVETLRSSRSVWAALKDRQLMKVLQNIDSAETREMALSRLQRAMEADDEFIKFTDELLNLIGHRARSEATAESLS